MASMELTKVNRSIASALAVMVAILLVDARASSEMPPAARPKERSLSALRHGEISDGQRGALDAYHPEERCVVKETEPAIEGAGRASYSLKRMKMVGGGKAPPELRAQHAIEENLVVGAGSLNLQHVSCSDVWMLARLTLPIAASSDASKLALAAKMLGDVSWSKARSAGVANEIRETLDDVAKMEKIPFRQMQQCANLVTEKKCLTVCLMRSDQECLEDIAIGIDGRDVVASYIDRP